MSTISSKSPALHTAVNTAPQSAERTLSMDQLRMDGTYEQRRKAAPAGGQPKTAPVSPIEEMKKENEQLKKENLQLRGIAEAAPAIGAALGTAQKENATLRRQAPANSGEIAAAEQKFGSIVADVVTEKAGKKADKQADYSHALATVSSILAERAQKGEPLNKPISAEEFKTQELLTGGRPTIGKDDNAQLIIAANNTITIRNLAVIDRVAQVSTADATAYLKSVVEHHAGLEPGGAKKFLGGLAKGGASITGGPLRGVLAKAGDSLDNGKDPNQIPVPNFPAKN